MLSSYLGHGLPTGVLPWNFHSVLFRYCSFINSDYMTDPL
jgi:hypothetical protein